LKNATADRLGGRALTHRDAGARGDGFGPGDAGLLARAGGQRCKQEQCRRDAVHDIRPPVTATTILREL
jgi:hypothetical protein